MDASLSDENDACVDGAGVRNRIQRFGEIAGHLHGRDAGNRPGMSGALPSIGVRGDSTVHASRQASAGAAGTSGNAVADNEDSLRPSRQACAAALQYRSSLDVVPVPLVRPEFPKKAGAFAYCPFPLPADGPTFTYAPSNAVRNALPYLSALASPMPSTAFSAASVRSFSCAIAAS